MRRRPTPGRDGWNATCPDWRRASRCFVARRVELLLPPCKQRISDDGRLRYLGGELPLSAGLAERATELAKRAVAALPPTIGYVGVDLVLGRDPHGGEDVVIEVNPRLTTSYVGLRAAAQANLAKRCGKSRKASCQKLSFASRPIEFDRAGNVSFMR